MSLGDRLAASASRVETATRYEDVQATDGPSTWKDDRIPLLTSLPGMLPGTDPVKDESDIVFLIETAMDEYGVRNPEELAEWVQRIQALAFRSRMIGQDGLSPTVREAPVRTLARYLREREMLLRTTHVI